MKTIQSGKMRNVEIWQSKKLFCVLATLIMMFGMYSLGISAEFSRSVSAQILQQLPTGVTIEEVHSADLNRDGVNEVIVFYYLPDPEKECGYPQSAVAIFSNSQKVFVDDPKINAGFAPNSLRKTVADVNGDGWDEIIITRVIGGSISTITLVKWDNVQKVFIIIPRIGPDDIGSAKLVDLDENGIYEIEEDFSLELPNFYKWDGKAYRIANYEYSNQYADTAKQCEQLLYSTQDIGVRLSYVSRAIEGLIYQKNYAKVFEIVKYVMDQCNNQKLSVEDRDFYMQKMYKYTGDIQMDLKNISAAKGEYRKAAEWKHEPEKRAIQNAPPLSWNPSDLLTTTTNLEQEIENSAYDMMKQYFSYRGIIFPEKPR